MNKEFLIIGAVIIVLLLAGIVILSRPAPALKRSREDFLQQLVNFLDGRLEPMAEQPNGYRIQFQFDSHDFIYEDIVEPGFKEAINKAYIKAKTSSSFSLYFTEKEAATSFRVDTLIVTELAKQPVYENVKIVLPKGFEKLKAFTNDPQTANKFLEDPRILSAYREFKNQDARGFLSVALLIVDGALVLELLPVGNFRASLIALQSHIPSIEDYLEKLVIIIDKLNKTSSWA